MRKARFRTLWSCCWVSWVDAGRIKCILWCVAARDVDSWASPCLIPLFLGPISKDTAAALFLRHWRNARLRFIADRWWSNFLLSCDWFSEVSVICGCWRGRSFAWILPYRPNLPSLRKSSPASAIVSGLLGVDSSRKLSITPIIPSRIVPVWKRTNLDCDLFRRDGSDGAKISLWVVWWGIESCLFFIGRPKWSRRLIVRFVIVFQAGRESRGAMEGHCKLVRNRDRKFDRRVWRILKNLA